MKRAAIIGMGEIYSVHLAAIENNPSIQLAGVCDIDEAKRDRAPDGVPYFTDYEEMLRKVQPDVVHVCLPHYLHVPVSEYCAGMGINVFCEKPVALNADQGRGFAEFEAGHPEVHIGICLQNRLNATVRALKEIIDSGRYGKVTGTKGIVPWYRDQSYYDTSPWRGRWETAGGGCMINQSVHTLDLLYYLGGEITDVKAMSGQITDNDIEVEDTVAASLHYANGARGLFLATNANYKNENVQISVQLENAEFLIMDNSLWRIDEDGAGEKLAEDEKAPGSKFYFGASHSRLIGLFYDALENDTQDYIHVEDALMSIRLIDAIRKSSAEGKKVEV